MSRTIDDGASARPSKSTTVDDLKSPQALKLNDEIQKVQKEYAKALSAVKALTESAEEVSKANHDEAVARADEAYKKLVDAINAKRKYIEAVIDKTKDIMKKGNDTYLRAGDTELSLLNAAMADLDAKLAELESGRGKKTVTKRRTSLHKNAKLEEEIAAVLEEAAKTKKGTNNKKEAQKVEAKKVTTKKATESGRYRLLDKYLNEAVPAMIKQFNYKNINEVPKLEKIVLNMGLGAVKDDAKKFATAVDELKLISGQKPVVAKAKKSVANFKVRKGMNVGAKVTLRSKRMYDFLDKLISIALPRVRDFKGLNPKSFDGRGNYALGVREQLIFPEIKYDMVDQIRGLDIIIVTTAKTDEEARALLGYLGMPFRS